MAYVVYDGSQVRPDQFVAAVEQAGLGTGSPELR
jgi:sensor c-di-GMP phosphodiesterase-like protein